MVAELMPQKCGWYLQKKVFNIDMLLVNSVADIQESYQSVTEQCIQSFMIYLYINLILSYINSNPSVALLFDHLVREVFWRLSCYCFYRIGFYCADSFIFINFFSCRYIPQRPLIEICGFSEWLCKCYVLECEAV